MTTEARKTRSQSKRIIFSERRLASLPPPKTGRVLWHDQHVPGLCLQVTAAGAKTFYSYLWANGQPVKVRLGSFPAVTVEAARKSATALNGKLAQGQNVVEERRRVRSVPTLADCFDRWLELHAKPHRRTWPDSVRQFNKYLAEFHGRRLNTITEADVSEWHGRIGRDHGPVQANRTLNLLSTLFRFAPKVGYDGANPCRSTSRFREVSRSRFLTAAEMGRFFQSVQRLEPVWRDYFIALLFTGQRRSTVAAMTWGQLDLKGCTWSIERTKNDQPLTIPLVPFVVNLLWARYEARGDSQWVFAGSRGHIVDARKAWAKVLRDSGISNLTLHDLRRSCGSWQAALGSSLAIIGASLGHKDLKSTQIYSRLDLQPIAQSVGRAVDAMLTAGGLLPKVEEEKKDTNG